MKVPNLQYKYIIQKNEFSKKEFMHVQCIAMNDWPFSHINSAVQYIQ